MIFIVYFIPLYALAQNPDPMDFNVSSDVAHALYKATYRSTKYQQLGLILDVFVRPEYYGANMNGNDFQSFEDVYQNTDSSMPIWVGGGGLEGTLWPTKNGQPWIPQAPKQRFFRFLHTIGYANHGWNQIWDQIPGDLIEQYSNHHLEYDRTYNNISSYAPDQPMILLAMNNRVDTLSYKGLAPGVRGLSIGQENSENAIGSLEGLTVDQNIYGKIGYNNQHQAIHTTQTCHGKCTDGLWGYAAAIGDSTGLNQHIAYAVELDITGNGSDKEHHYRNFLRFGGNVQSMNDWESLHNYNSGDIISNIFGVFYCLKGGESSENKPSFKSNNYKFIDGSVIWKRINDFEMSVGDGIWYGGGGNIYWSYEDGISGDGNFNDAFINTSRMHFKTNAYPIRIGSNQAIEFSGETKSLTSHSLSYITSENGLEYKVNNDWVVHVSDVGGLITKGEIKSGSYISLANFTKQQLRALRNYKIQNGSMAYDATDDFPVIYRNGEWYPIKLGEALK